MDRFRQKSKKEKPMKYVDKDQSPLYITDVKAMKENLKIKEILRTVKMNSSMRIKAPKGSKVMQNKDFNDNEDIFGGEQNSEYPNLLEPPSATNPDVVVTNNSGEVTNENNIEELVDKLNESDEVIILGSIENNNSVDTKIHESSSVPEGLTDFVLISDENINVVPNAKIDLPPLGESSQVKTRERKLSLDQTMLSKRGGLSQSELDLNSIGKSPLERKSSFFRKKMDSFLKNTTEIFKRQSITRSQSIQRRGSMSVSVQSLNEKTVCSGDYREHLHHHQEENQRTSLQSSPTPACSTSSLSIAQSEQTLPDPQSEGDSLAGSRPALTCSQPLGDVSPSIHSLNEACIQEAMLNRAISMSSGLDTAHGKNRRKSRSNRVSWLASEGLTNYFRRVQDEKNKDLNMCHSYQDFSSIPENKSSQSKTESKGRRLSYQRAVSGEDPRYHESTIKRKQNIPENTETKDLADLLEQYTKHGMPELQGFCIVEISDKAFEFLQWAENPDNLEDVFDWTTLSTNEDSRQAVIRELVATESDYVHHLLAIVQVFIAVAHDLQDNGKLLDIDTQKLFGNIPDILNASLFFWESTIYPMVADAYEKQTPYNTAMMEAGFMNFREVFLPYEKYVNDQPGALEYLRSLSHNDDFIAYISWCYQQKLCNRLQLADIMVKPMQRLTKYSLLLQRIISYTDGPERASLEEMHSCIASLNSLATSASDSTADKPTAESKSEEVCAKTYVQNLNRTIRQREEYEKMDYLASAIEAYEIDFRDEELDKSFRLYAQINIKGPMINCSVQHTRMLIYQGDLRYKDNLKEMDAHVFLLTDMMLICKKLSKTSVFHYRLVRPKYFIEKLIIFPKISPRNPKELGSLVFVAIDEVGSSYVAFSLSEISKDANSLGTLKTWENKFREAKLTYDFALWYTRNPSRDLSDMDLDSSSEVGGSFPSTSRPGIKQSSDEINIDREARERIAAMHHRGDMGVSTEGDVSQVSMNTESFECEPSTSHAAKWFPLSLRHPLKRASTGGSSRNSRLSSFQQSTSAASHDEPQPGPSRYDYQAGTSVEHVIPPLNPDDGVRSITVNVVSESESETVVQAQVPAPPLVVLQHSSPHKSPLPSRSSSASRNTLGVSIRNAAMTLMHSMPDLTVEDSQNRQQSPSPQSLSASEKLYLSHQELLNKNRLAAQKQHQRYLSPDNRGTSYPPPSPTRASLKRGLAFSYSFKNPPLSKMGHVNSQSQQAEAGPSTSQGAKGDKGPSPGPSTENTDKKSKNLNTRNKSGSASPSSRKEDKAE